VSLELCGFLGKYSSLTMRKLIAIGLTLTAVSILGLGATEGLHALTPRDPAQKALSVLEISKGQTPFEVAGQMEKSGIIRDSARFLRLGKLLRKWRGMKAGEYEVSASMTPLQLLDVITSGISLSHPITIKEGDNLYEIANQLESRRLAPKTEILRLARDPAWIQAQLGTMEGVDPRGLSLEGYLFPDTYHLNRGQTPEEILRTMVRKFRAVWTEEYSRRARELGFSRHQILTLASMIEKETGASEERPRISSVFHNRLRKKMRLQSDPTTIYGIWERFDGNIHKSDLLEATPFNTYTLPGLPVGPIANPGKAAIEAALNPMATEDLFFVSHNDGTHEFTRTFEAHQAAVRKFQLDRKAREGKSWRDLKAASNPTPGSG
jgi:UPF0755 protein